MPSRQQLKQLELALINAFPSKSLLERLLYYELEKNLNQITKDSNLQEIVFKLIQTAESQEWLIDLVYAARKENPKNSELAAIALELFPIVEPKQTGHETSHSPRSNISQKPNNQRQESEDIQDITPTPKPNILQKPNNMTFKLAVLSIDGGGIRGIFPAMILAEIENLTGKSICQLFDFIAGTSTGGILALGLTRPSKEDNTKPQFTAIQLVDLYRQEGGIIFQRRKEQKLNLFDHVKINALRLILNKFAPEVEPEDLFSSRYSQTGKKDLINRYLGNTHIKDALTEIFITSYAINLRKLIFFTSNSRKEQEYKTSQSFRVLCEGYEMRQAALATSAAPTYFKPYLIDAINHPDKGYTLVDGGVFANNPTSIAIIEAMNSYKAKTGENISLSDLLVVSVGTGRKARGLDINDIADWGQIKWIEPLIDMSLNGQSEVVNYQMEQLLSNKLPQSIQEQQYYRFQPQYSENKGSTNFSVDEDDLFYVNDKIDDSSPNNISNLISSASKFINMEEHNLVRLARQLLALSEK